MYFLKHGKIILKAVTAKDQVQSSVKMTPKRQPPHSLPLKSNTCFNPGSSYYIEVHDRFCVMFYSVCVLGMPLTVTPQTIDEMELSMLKRKLNHNSIQATVLVTRKLGSLLSCPE